jgi:hypothetical protein
MRQTPKAAPKNAILEPDELTRSDTRRRSSLPPWQTGECRETRPQRRGARSRRQTVLEPSIVIVPGAD